MAKKETTTKKAPGSDQWRKLLDERRHVCQVLINNGQTEYKRHNIDVLPERSAEDFFRLQNALVKTRDDFPHLFFHESKAVKE